MKKQNPSVCVIGAGCFGIAAIKNLLQAGVRDVICCEQKRRGPNFRDFPDSKRHTKEVHFHPYARRLNAHIPKHKPEWRKEVAPKNQSA